jgi:hypothetical protein
VSATIQRPEGGAGAAGSRTGRSSAAQSQQQALSHTLWSAAISDGRPSRRARTAEVVLASDGQHTALPVATHKPGATDGHAQPWGCAAVRGAAVQPCRPLPRTARWVLLPLSAAGWAAWLKKLTDCTAVQL